MYGHARAYARIRVYKEENGKIFQETANFAQNARKDAPNADKVAQKETKAAKNREELPTKGSDPRHFCLDVPTKLSKFLFLCQNLDKFLLSKM